MKIYTITCSNAYNYGAVLQSYALQHFLEKLGNDVEVIDYFPPYLRKISDKYKNRGLIKLIRTVLYAPDYTKSKIIFGKFKKEIKCTKKKYCSIEELKQLPAADLYIAGSDQIWNPYMKNGLDPNYFMEFAADRKRISYAASVGCEIPEKEYDDYFRERLSSFSAITVREKKTADYFQSIGLHANDVVDPVYLLQKDEWDKLCCAPEKEEYVLVYALHHVQEIYDYARKLADKLGVKMYVISVEIKECRRGNDRFFWNPSVNQYLSLIRNTRAVVTNSFHGLSFGMIFERPLHIFDTETEDLRLKNVIHKFGLEKRVVQITDNRIWNNEVLSEAAIRMKREIKRSEIILKNMLER